MYRIGHSQSGRNGRKRRAGILSARKALFLALLGTAFVFFALGKSGTFRNGTGAYFNDTESAAIQFNITVESGTQIAGSGAGSSSSAESAGNKQAGSGTVSHPRPKAGKAGSRPPNASTGKENGNAGFGHPKGPGSVPGKPEPQKD